MQLNSLEVTDPPRDAATVVLLRESGGALEVFMLQRAAQSEVLGGAYVFPGGKVDAADAAPQAIERLDAAPAALREALGEPALAEAAAAAFFVAACRETFEEAGVLLSAGAGAEAAEAGARHAAEGASFAELLARLGHTLETRNLVPWSRWITPRIPSVQNKRFDTRFFLALAPSGQTARHDDYEATAGAWLRPRDALDRYWAREIELAPPQIMSLAHLSRHGSAEEAMQAARGRRPPVIQPEPFDLEGTRVVAYPGDPRHPLPDRALPGPTRLRFRKGRFEPFDGFEEFFR